MTYESLNTISQTVSLLIFLSLFVVVLGYLFWPSTRDKLARRLEQDQRHALDLDTEGMPGGRQ